MLVHLADCGGERDRDTQESGQIGRPPVVPLENPLRELTAGILKYEDRALFVTRERHRGNCSRRIELSCPLVFMFEPPERGARATQDLPGSPRLPILRVLAKPV